MLELVTLPCALYLVTKWYKLAQKEKRFYMIPNFRLFGVFGLSPFLLLYTFLCNHRLRTSGEEIVVSARPTTKSQSQIFRYGQSLFCLPQRPKISDFFDLCLHWMSVVRALGHDLSCSEGIWRSVISISSCIIIHSVWCCIPQLSAHFLVEHIVFSC